MFFLLISAETISIYEDAKSNLPDFFLNNTCYSTVKNKKTTQNTYNDNSNSVYEVCKGDVSLRNNILITEEEIIVDPEVNSDQTRMVNHIHHITSSQSIKDLRVLQDKKIIEINYKNNNTSTNLNEEELHSDIQRVKGGVKKLSSNNLIKSSIFNNQINSGIENQADLNNTIKNIFINKDNDFGMLRKRQVKENHQIYDIEFQGGIRQPCCGKSKCIIF